MIKKAYINKKWIVSGFINEDQNKNIIKTGFNNKIFKVFENEKEVNCFLKKLKGGKK